jgi:hypothetical protein
MSDDPTPVKRCHRGSDTHGKHQGDRSGIHAMEECACERRLAQFWNERAADKDKHKGRKENTDGSHGGNGVKEQQDFVNAHQLQIKHQNTNDNGKVISGHRLTQSEDGSDDDGR